MGRLWVSPQKAAFFLGAEVVLEQWKLKACGFEARDFEEGYDGYYSGYMYILILYMYMYIYMIWYDLD